MIGKPFNDTILVMTKEARRLFDFFSQPKYLFCYALLILVMLLLRNPFSQRTLIPNLEPYPDTIHYLTPARSLVSGGPFKITREGRTVNQGVPPLYSLAVAPFYLVNSDVRMFYIANVFLTLVSLALFYLILKKITDDKWVIGLTLFLFATNFFVSWYPQWAMAENLVMPLFLGGVYLLLSKVNTTNLLLAGLIPISLFATKYANIPLTAVYSLLYLLKIIFDFRKDKKILFKKLGAYILVTAVLSAGIIAYGYFVNGLNFIAGLMGVIKATFGGISSGASTAPKVSNPWMSFIYLKTNLPQYLNALIGRNERFLWDFTPMVARWVGELGIVGLVMGCFSPKKTRFLFFSMVLMLLSEIIFMSTFYAVDMRYIYFAIPTLLFGFSLFFSNLKSVFKKAHMYFLFVLIVFAAFGYYFAGNAIRIKSQIVINVKYAETPWYYISVLKLNDYFVDKVNDKPFVISPMPPYYIDFYSNGNYRLLPLSLAQEFRSGKTIAWGDYDYSDLHAIYQELLKKGGKLYVSTYGLGNEAYLHKSFDDLNKDFKLTEVQNECYTQCKIFKLELKNAKGI